MSFGLILGLDQFSPVVKGRPTIRYACKECLRRMCQEHYQRKRPLPIRNADPLPRQQNPPKETYSQSGQLLTLKKP
jgi:hypothetical protein